MKWWICILDDLPEGKAKPVAMFATQGMAEAWVAESDRSYKIISRIFHIAGLD